MNQQQEIIDKSNNIYAWVVTLIGSLFFFYAFFQCNMMTPLQQSLQQHFSADAATIGLLSACFFYGNVLFLLPAGLLVDRYPIKKIMVLGMILAIFGAYVFAFSSNLYMACIGRFMSGMMMSFGLIVCIKLASIWLPADKMALASSLIITIGTLGGIAAQTPMMMLKESFGWQHSVFIIALLGMVIAFILWFVIKEPNSENLAFPKQSVWSSLKAVLKKGQNWLVGLYICLLNFPIAILGALFGITYLMQVYHMSSILASSIVSMLFVGMIIGAPFFGWFSDRLKKRKTPMWIGSILCLVSICVFMFSSHLSPLQFYILFFLVGFFSGAQVLGYPVIAESNPISISGTALSFAAMIIMGVGYGIAIPFVGWLLKIFWDGVLINNIATYSLTTYRFAFLSLPIGVLISLILLFFIKETHMDENT